MHVTLNTVNGVVHSNNKLKNRSLCNQPSLWKSVSYFAILLHDLLCDNSNTLDGTLELDQYKNGEFGKFWHYFGACLCISTHLE